MSADELFTPAEVEKPSPRLQWLKQHDLVTAHFPDIQPGDESPETGDDLYPWICRINKNDGSHWSPKQIGGGNNEADAIMDFCNNSGIAHWTQL